MTRPSSSLHLPSTVLQLPKRRFKLDQKSEYYTEDRLLMKQYAMVHFRELYATYSNIIIFEIDKVRGEVLTELRHEVRLLQFGEFLIGKNTVINRVIEEMEESSNDLERNALRELRKHMVGHICLFFTNENCAEMRSFVESKVTEEFAKFGDKIMEDYYIEPHLTELDPSRTSFFGALNIATKITKGRIEILNHVKILRKGDLVGLSESILLQRLKLKAFKHGCKARLIFDRENYCMYPPDVLNYNLSHSIYEAMNNIGSITMECNLENQLSVIIDLKKGIMNLLSLEHEVESYEMRSIENDDVD